MYTDDLIYGKNKTEKIVCIEPQDGFAEVFTQNQNGDVSVSHVPNRYWTLFHNPIKDCKVLKGNLHYRYGKQYTNRQEWYIDKKRYKDKDCYSVHDPKESLMINNGYTYYKGLNPKDVSILSFDIESTGLNHDENSKVLIISNTFRKNRITTRKLFAYDEYEHEGEMIVAWCDWVREINPSIITGHNIEGYDLSYLDFVASNHGVELLLGRNGSKLSFNNYESKYRVDGSKELHYKRAHCYGREIIDTLFLAYKYDATQKKYVSYGLKSIIAQEGLEVKDRQFYDAATIRDNYKILEEWIKIKKYAEFDADDALALYDLMCPAFFYMCQSIPKSWQSVIESASGSQINSIMVRSYLQNGHSVPKADLPRNFSGGISFAVPGVYRNVLKIDIASLYPNIMREYKVFEESKDPNGYFLKLTEYFLSERIKNKKLFKETQEEKYDYLQASQKIFANSLFGFLGAPGLNFNSPDKAEFITTTGREILSHTIQWASGKSYEYWRNLFEEKTK